LGDPSLTGLSGHSARYFQAVAQELKRQKCNVQILGNRQLPAELAGLLVADPVFSLACDAQPVVFHQGMDHRSVREATCRRHEEAILADLRRLDRMYRFHAGDVVLLNSFRQWPLRGLVDWLEELPSMQAPILVIVLHYTPHATPGEAGPVVEEYRRAFERMAASPVRERFMLMADSRELQQEFGRISPIPVGLLPIPHCGEIPVAAKRDRARDVRFAFVGEARTDKGFHLLPDLVLALESRAACPLRFSIQGYSPDHQDVVAGTARDRLEQFEQVDLIPDALTDEEYKALIADADVIILPYLQRHYHAQTSGIFAEAMSAGTPTIVPSGTWMATQAEQYGVGIVFEAGNLESLIEACQQAIATLSELRDRAADVTADWRQIHNAANFVATLQDSIRRAGLRVPPPC
jgi:glycosyltransferase involved in cell wall biosynthesis